MPPGLRVHGHLFSTPCAFLLPVAHGPRPAAFCCRLFLFVVWGAFVMSPSSAQAGSSAPEFDGILRNRLEREPVKVIAADTDIDPSLLGKFLKGTAALQIDDVAKLIRRAGLKAVDQRRTCVDPGYLNFLRRLAQRVESHASWLLTEDDV